MAMLLIRLLQAAAFSTWLTTTIAIIAKASSIHLWFLAGTDKSIQTALQKSGLEKLKRVVKSLTANGHIRTLLFHWFGNYTLQDLVGASSKLRTAAIAALAKAQVPADGIILLLMDVQSQPANQRMITRSWLITIHGSLDLLGVKCSRCAHCIVSAAGHRPRAYADGGTT